MKHIWVLVKQGKLAQETRERSEGKKLAIWSIFQPFFATSSDLLPDKNTRELGHFSSHYLPLSLCLDVIVVEFSSFIVVIDRVGTFSAHGRTHVCLSAEISPYIYFISAQFLPISSSSFMSYEQSGSKTVHQIFKWKSFFDGQSYWNFACKWKKFFDGQSYWNFACKYLYYTVYILIHI